MNNIEETVLVVGAPSMNCPPIAFEVPFKLGFVDAEEILDLVLSEKNEQMVYTVGFHGNLKHLWKIVDHVVCVPEKTARNHPVPKYIILYYEPVNREAVLRDCAPHLLNLPDEDLEDLID